MPHPIDGEQVIFRVRPSSIPFIALIGALTTLAIVIALAVNTTSMLLTIATLVIAGFVDFVIILSYVNTIYTLANDRVTLQTGIIGIKIETIELDKKIAEVELQQGLLGRIFNYGDIKMEGDNPQAIFVFKAISKPGERYDQIREQMMQHPRP